MKISSAQGIGERDSQQDAFGIDQINKGQALAVVADGMGGLVNSGQVSQLVVDSILGAYAPDDRLPVHYQLLRLLKRALSDVQKATEDKTYDSGSTLVCCHVSDNALTWLSVGDSRICLWRKGGLIQLNRDHDFARDLAIMTMNEGYTPEDALSNPRQDALTSYIGRDTPRHMDFNSQPVTLRKGDKILLMTDGVYRCLSEAALSRFLKKKPKRAAAAIEKAIRKMAMSQQDNYTAVIIGV